MKRLKKVTNEWMDVNLESPPPRGQTNFVGLKKITHTWQGAPRAPTPSTGARTRGP